MMERDYNAEKQEGVKKQAKKQETMCNKKDKGEGCGSPAPNLERRRQVWR